MLHPGKISLMIVEDDANIRYLMQTAAERADAFDPIWTEEDGQAALDSLRNCTANSLPTMIVSDLVMPRMTGLQLLQKIKSDPTLRHIPVAIITSSNVPHDREEALALGACAYVEKPHGLAALTEALLTLRILADQVPAATTPGRP
jgi:CheY-like chemotaxis protein